MKPALSRPSTEGRRNRVIHRTLRLTLPLVALASLVLGHAGAEAAGKSDEKRACVAASEEAQLRRIQKKLRGAHEELLVCARDVCPVLVKHDCEQWLAEVEASLPSIVVSALDKTGHDTGDVRVTVDGEPFLERLDGNAVTIDPGEHTMRFSHGDDPAIEQKIIVREGEKNRLVSIQWSPPAVTAIPLVTASTLVAHGGRPHETAENETPSRAVPILAFSLIGVGAAVLGVATYFEVEQLNNYSTLQHTCSPSKTCTEGQVESISSERVDAGVSLGAGLAAAGVGVILLLTRPKPTPHATDSASGGEDHVAAGIYPTHGGVAGSFALSF